MVDTVLMSAQGDELSLNHLDSYDGVVILGGPMGALDDRKFPSLAVEREIAREAVKRRIPILGVCLGHQLLAVALGGELLAAATEEIGVGTVQLASDSPYFGDTNQQIPVVHWHRDSVTPPPGATILATTEQCPVQAFRLGSAIGVQFHVELTPQLFSDWLHRESMIVDLPAGVSPAELSSDFNRSAGELAAIGSRLINGFLSDVADSRQG
ncbi:MAG: type 1 glutamine amidotransferase [Actinobacteria bacterium]|nr:type 1 glutamine amidotransferase [Actinomycetota bacterium]